jgi:phosphoribosylcarboxyaminoimidazole (NCAIR) mutase
VTERAEARGVDLVVAGDGNPDVLVAAMAAWPAEPVTAWPFSRGAGRLNDRARLPRGTPQNSVLLRDR